MARDGTGCPFGDAPAAGAFALHTMTRCCDSDDAEGVRMSRSESRFESVHGNGESHKAWLVGVAKSSVLDEAVAAHAGVA